jgi:hypothetical protein
MPVASGSPRLFAGPDQPICQGTNSVQLAGDIQGTVNNASEWDWILPDGGTLSNPDKLNSDYTLPPGFTSGTISIVLKSNVVTVACPVIQDTMQIIVKPTPTATISVTGANPICAGASSSVSFTATPNTTVTYKINNGTNQTILVNGTGSATLTTTALSANTTYTLVSVAYSATEPCTQSLTTSATITVNQLPTVNAGIDQTVCASIPNVTLSASFGGGATSAIWNTSGSGTFSNNSPTAVYTPGTADISAGSVTVTYTTDDPAGPCGPVSDQMIITINPAPVANAGADQTVCASGAAVTLAGAISGSATSGTWSGGTGTFSPNNNSLTATYTPTAAEIASGSVTLTLTTNDPVGPCAATTDQVLITINPSATVSAGSTQTICSNTPATLNGSFGGGATSATWSTSGSGTFSNNSPTAVYTPSTADISAGQ